MTHNSTIERNRIDHLFHASSRAIYCKPCYIDKLVDTAWAIAFTALWNGCILLEREKLSAKKAIRKMLLLHSEPMKAYDEFVHRVLLAQYYYESHPYSIKPTPVKWLDKENKVGYSRTKPGFETICEERKANPLYKIEYRIFALAVWDVQTAKESHKFRNWRGTFLEQYGKELYGLFFSTVLNCLNPW